MADAALGLMGAVRLKMGTPPGRMGHSCLRSAFLWLVWLVWSVLQLAHAGSFHPSFPNGVAAGDVTGTSAVLWTRTTNVGPLTFTWSTNAALLPGGSQRVVEATNPAVPVKVVLGQLAPDNRYFYQVADHDGNTQAGTFHTAATDEAFHGLRFGVSGDWRGDLAPFPSIANAATANLDFFVALGDTMYADVPSPAVPSGSAQTLEEFRSKYAEVYGPRFGLSALADLRASTAHFAVIDDHEVVNNFAGGAGPDSDPRFSAGGAYINESPFYRNGVQAFVEYHPIQAIQYESPTDARTHHKPKFYRTQNYGNDAALFLLDARSFRDPPLASVSNPLDSSEVTRFNALTFDRSPTNGAALPPRTLLGTTQLALLKADLRAAQERGVVWKFICLPEPIQSLGFADAADRFEGYARERAELLAFIAETPIQNVVFVSADLHGTLVNDLRYRLAPAEADRRTGAFEIITGSVAYDRPLGPTTFDYADSVLLAPGLSLLQGLLQLEGLPNRAAFEALPRSEKDRHVRNMIDFQLNLIGLDPTGLEGSDINATLLQGDYVAVHTFGWTSFAIDRDTHRLTVTTYGIPAYSPQEVSASLLGRVPEVISQFRVEAKVRTVVLPALVAVRDGEALKLSWRATSAGFVLQVASQLNDSSDWAPEAVAPVLVGEQNTVTLSPTNQARFFRLRRK